MIPARELNELLRLDDDAFVTTREATAVLCLGEDTLCYYRKLRPHRSPKYVKLGVVVRYRMGDLRAYVKGDPSGFQTPPVVAEG